MAHTMCCGLRIRFAGGAVCDLPDVIAYEETQQGLLYTAPRFARDGYQCIGDEVYFIEWRRIDSFIGYQSARWKDAEDSSEEAVTCYPNLRPKERQFAPKKGAEERPTEFRYPRTSE